MLFIFATLDPKYFHMEELNFAWIGTSICSPINPLPAWCMDNHSWTRVMWSSRICIFKVLVIPLKSLSNVQKKFLMAWPCGKN